MNKLLGLVFFIGMSIGYFRMFFYKDDESRWLGLATLLFNGILFLSFVILSVLSV
jgi:hypothetical protein